MQNINSEQLQQILTLMYVLAISLVVLATVGLSAAVVVLRQNKAMLQMLFQSASPETQKLLRGIAAGVNEVADLAVEVTNPDKPSAAVTTTTTTTTSAEPIPPKALPADAGALG